MCIREQGQLHGSLQQYQPSQQQALTAKEGPDDGHELDNLELD